MSLWDELLKEKQKMNIIIFGLLLIFFGSLLLLFLFTGMDAVLFGVSKNLYIIIHFASWIMIELGMLFLSIGVLISSLMDKEMETSIRIVLLIIALAMLIILLLIDISLAKWSFIFYHS